jgi:hypothetical protein
MDDVDLTCAICFRIFYDPITSLCNHTFCRGCLKKYFKKSNQSCPLCRLELHDWNIAEHPTNAEIKGKLKSEANIELYKQRKKEEQEEKLVEENTLHIKISIGNLHQSIPSQGQNSHKWTFFLLPHDGVIDLKKYIRDVTVVLHPTFNPSRVVLSEEPFMFSRIGWGVFVLRIFVRYHAHLQKPNDEFTHALSFQSNGSSTSYELEFDKSKIPADEANEEDEENEENEENETNETNETNAMDDA